MFSNSFPRRPNIVYIESVNIIIKSFDGLVDKRFLERALRGMNIGTCVSISNDKNMTPNIAAKEHIWMEERPLREGRYEGIDWNSLAPLDEELIEQMRHCEAVFMNMVGKYVSKTRFAFSGSIPYEERKRQYFEHLRYWNDFLDTRKIDLVLMYHVPHKCYDYVLYGLCKIKGIPILYIEFNHAIDAMFIVEDWEASVVQLRDRILELQTEYREDGKPVPLSQNYETYFQHYRNREPTRWYKPNIHALAQGSFIQKWYRKAWKVCRKNPTFFIKAVLSPQFWSYKLRQHRTIQFYYRHTQTPDLSKPFIYVPLHHQPEATTVPMAGAFADQERIIQLIAAYLPKNIAILVKEHPAQGERYRSEEFYQALLDIPAVTFIPKEMNTIQLIDHSLAIATGTGTVCFEAFLRQKPVLMFGHYFYQYAPGVFRIRTSKDCEEALNTILHTQKLISERDVRIFLKALEECATPFPGPPDSPHERYTQDEKTDLVGALIEKKILAAVPGRFGA